MLRYNFCDFTKMRALIIILLMVHTANSSRMAFRLGRSSQGGLGAPAGAEDLQLPLEQWFEQKLDHNNPSDLRTWSQRYFVNDEFFESDNPGPVFLMIGGEGPADARWMVKGFWIEYAMSFRALCFQLEHRYYGESHPTEDTSVKNLQYLSSLQALEDIAYFIAAMNKNYKLSSDVQWIVFGGSYPGSLAAWARLKYPHLIYAAVSSSGPLLAKVNFYEYYQAVLDSIREKTGNNDCVRLIELGQNQVQLFAATDPERIERLFRVCQPFYMASSNDLNNFYNTLANNFAELVQYNEDNRFTGDVHYKNVTINTVCDLLNNTHIQKLYEGIAKFNDIMLNKSKEECLDYNYDKMISELSDTTWNEESGRQWMWQTCTEFGFYQTNLGVEYIFGRYFPLDFFVQQCIEVFGFKYRETFIREAVDWTNNKYGALDVKASRIIFVHGSIDPWHKLGIIESDDDETPAIYINGTAHCANMYPPAPEDSAELTEARIKIRRILSSWTNRP